MGLRDDIQADLREAMDDADGFADIVETFHFIQETGGGEYDPETDSYGKSETLTESRGIFKNVPVRYVDGTNIFHSDEFLVVNGIDCTIVPETDMQIKRADGRLYRIVRPGKVPGGASPAIVYKMLVRRFRD